MPLLPEQDSVQLQTDRHIMYRQFLSGISPTGDLMKLPQFAEFDFNSGQTDRWKYNLNGFSINHWGSTGFLPGFSNIHVSPFLQSGTVFTKGSYNLGEKFRLGGYSYGANSIFSAPFPNQGINNYDFRGSTLFMQYKVSKNFKIETRVNVIQGPNP